ncbi:MAG TPA: GyrI-like domain-containing protein [Solirubrobacteraceae bacterium]|nr:GyrI-like domain-containing protein [Solirubrobacteraceae bacterium]
MSTTKVDMKRELPDLYRPGTKPRLVDVPELGFIMVDGHGDPNTAPAYSDAIQALYAVAYTVKFAVKRSPDGVDFAVMPLESLWWSDDDASFTGGEKGAWSWTAMIMQPEPVSGEIVADAIRVVEQKKSLPSLAALRYERFTEGLAAQVMYVGPYSDEGPTIAALHGFIADQGLELAGKHHEIYLGDPRRTAPARLKTVIRQPVRQP